MLTCMLDRTLSTCCSSKSESFCPAHHAQCPSDVCMVYRVAKLHAMQGSGVGASACALLDKGQSPEQSPTGHERHLQLRDLLAEG